MAKANIVLPNGSKVDIEGTPDEIQKILEALGKSSHGDSTTTTDTPAPARIPRKKEKLGLTGLLLELKTQGFFREKRSLKEIQERLESEGFIYPTTSIQPILLNLLKSRQIGRVKEDGTWKYVNR